MVKILDDIIKKLYTKKDEMMPEIKKAYYDTKTAISNAYSDLESLYDSKGKPEVKKWQEKAQEVMKDSESAAKKYGQKFVNNMKDLTSKTVTEIEHTIDAYRKPTQEELDTIYKGLGARYNSEKGVLLKKDYDECLDFLKKANACISEHEHAVFKPIILEDIKASVSSTPQELNTFYNDIAFGTTDDTLKKKKTIIDLSF